MSIALLVMTDGRRSCISRSIPSALDMLEGPFTEFIICDDSADPDYQSWLNRSFPDFDIICSTERRGFGGNIQRAWDFIRTYSGAPYVLATEDDFIFNRRVDLQAMMRVLNRNPHLWQLVLKRQPWNALERAAGGIIEQHPEAYTQCSDDEGNQWVEHQMFFSTNTYLAHHSLMEERWPEGSESEGHFTHQLLAKAPDRRFAFWGHRADKPWIEHIGMERVGVGY